MSFYNLTVDATAGNVIYLPTRDDVLSEGWNFTLKSSTALRQTVKTGATVQLSWVGTAVQLFGLASTGTYKQH